MHYELYMFKHYIYMYVLDFSHENITSEWRMRFISDKYLYVNTISYTTGREYRRE